MNSSSNKCNDRPCIVSLRINLHISISRLDIALFLCRTMRPRPIPFLCHFDYTCKDSLSDCHKTRLSKTSM